MRGVEGMTSSDMVLLLTLLPLAMAYAWGMRGCILGGEKGAMLPGAVAGLLLARFSGIPAVAENWYFLAAAGAAAFSLGGSMTYGETLGLSINGIGTPAFKKGLWGVAVKGFVWFGCAAAVLGVVTVSLRGSLYASLDAALGFCACVPAYILGRALLNRPSDPKTNRFPKLYFSKTRSECWGGGLFVLLTLALLAAVRSDTFTLVFAAIGGLFGAVGWVLGQLLHIYAHRPLKSGRLLFGTLQKNGYIGGWKLMECFLGGMGGLGLAAGFILLRGKLDFPADVSTLFLPYEAYDRYALLLWLGLFLLNTLRLFIEPNPKKERIEALFRQGALTEREYTDSLKRLEKPLFLGEKRAVLREVSEGVDYVLYGLLPVLACVLGFPGIARLTAVFALFWVLTDEICFDTFLYRGCRNVTRAVMLGLSAVILVTQLLRPDFFTLGRTAVLYFVSYELLQFIWQLRPFDFKKRRQQAGSLRGAMLSYKSGFSMHCFFVPVCLLLDILGLTVL